jgi:hypothetical protein
MRDDLSLRNFFHGQTPAVGECQERTDALVRQGASALVVAKHAEQSGGNCVELECESGGLHALPMGCCDCFDHKLLVHRRDVKQKEVWAQYERVDSQGSAAHGGAVP